MSINSRANRANKLYAELAARIARTERNLDTATGGHPSRTAGSGDPPTSHPGFTADSSVERLANKPDIARLDLTRLHHAQTLIDRGLAITVAVVSAWDYPTGNEYDPVIPRPAANPNSTNTPLPTCRTCILIQKVEPIYRSDQCQWCYRFRTTEGFDPPPWLLAARHEGRRTTMAMVERARLEQPRKTRKRKRKAS